MGAFVSDHWVMGADHLDRGENLEMEEEEVTFELPWSKHPFNRCSARLEPKGQMPYWGRCELKRHKPQLDHALERGFDIVRFETRIIGATTRY